MGGSARPSWALSVTQHRTTPCESPTGASWCTQSFPFQVPPGSIALAQPRAGDASSASRGCRCLPLARAHTVPVL